MQAQQRILERARRGEMEDETVIYKRREEGDEKRGPMYCFRACFGFRCL